MILALHVALVEMEIKWALIWVSVPIASSHDPLLFDYIFKWENLIVIVQ